MRCVAVCLVVLLVASSVLSGCFSGDVPDPNDKTTEEMSVFSDTDVFAGEYNTSMNRVLERGPHEILEQRVTLLESELDGADIQVYVMRPDLPEDQKAPVIVDAGPYFPPLEGVDLSEVSLLLDFVSHGYAFALVSVRGTGDSGGCMDFMGDKERHDIDQAITWLGTQSWSNGNVGMFGGSYDGSTQWTAASTGNPHLKTIVPLAGIPDLYGFMVRNGTWMTWTPGIISGLYWAMYGPVAYNPTNGRSVENTLAQLACPESKTGMAVGPHTVLTGERDPLGWWAERNHITAVETNYNGTIYLIHGFKDGTVEPHTAYPWMNRLQEQGIVVKHTLGPWGHEFPWRADSMEILLHWYDRWLKEDETRDIGPGAQIMDNQGNWRSEETWPPTDSKPLRLHLTETGTLELEPTVGADSHLVGPMAPVHDPVAFSQRFNGAFKIYDDPAFEACTACPVYTMEPQEEDLRFAGLPRLHVTATPTGPGGHITAALRVVEENGAKQAVGFAQMDLRFAAGGETSASVVPGEPVLARMQFQPLDVVVPAGAQLELTLHQGSYGVRMPSLPSYPVTVGTGGTASTLTLDAFTRTAEDLHEAPPRVGTPQPPR